MLVRRVHGNREDSGCEMSQAEFSEDMRSLLTNALTLAADRYAENAKTFREKYEPAGIRDMAAQFQRQARQTRALVTIIDDAEALLVTGDHVTMGQVNEWRKL